MNAEFGIVYLDYDHWLETYKPLDSDADTLLKFVHNNPDNIQFLKSLNSLGLVWTALDDETIVHGIHLRNAIHFIVTIVPRSLTLLGKRLIVVNPTYHELHDDGHWYPRETLEEESDDDGELDI